MTKTDAPSHEALQTRCLSQDFIAFDDGVETVYDLVIVGSGYGAAMAAYTFAGCSGPDSKPLRIALFERGREYLPGAFPASFDELPGHVRLSRGRDETVGLPEALFDLRLAGDVSALVANGLGGGSLINAGVMVEARFGRFDSRLPRHVEQDLLASWYNEAAPLLGAKVQGSPNTIQRHQAVRGSPLEKTEAIQRLSDPDNSRGSVTGEKAAITVRLDGADNAGQSAKLSTCTLCGDCLTGCNVGAKLSLDTNLLLDACNSGVSIYTSATVLRLERAKNHGESEQRVWELHLQHTDPQVQRRRGKPVRVRAYKVILAAGTFGSTEILLRSQGGMKAQNGEREADADSRPESGGSPTDSRQLRKRPLLFSSRLGEQFSLNGDNTAFVRFETDVNAVGDEAVPVAGPGGTPSARHVGPEITQILQFPYDADGPGFLVQEFAIPAALRGVYHEIVTSRAWLDDLSAGDFQTHRATREEEEAADPLAIDETAMRRELMVGLIGHDSAAGRLVLPRESGHEGCIEVRWKDVALDPAMAQAFARLEKQIHKRQVSGALPAEVRVTPNPLWRLLPAALGGIVDNAPGGALTVHPLGGCPMGSSALTGVVDEWGAVFDLMQEEVQARYEPDDWQGSLLVLDGAIIPASLGANPALTIAALSLRAARHWQKKWEWHPAAEKNPEAKNSEPPESKPRPRARHLEHCHLLTPLLPTKVQFVERLVGLVKGLRGPEGRGDYMVELTFGFAPVDTREIAGSMHKRLLLDPSLRNEMPGANTLRIYKYDVWKDNFLDAQDDDTRDAHAEVVARLATADTANDGAPGVARTKPPEAHMDLLVRQRSWAWWRLLRAGMAFARNRGLRDLRRWWLGGGLLKCVRERWEKVKAWVKRLVFARRALANRPRPRFGDGWFKTLMKLVKLATQAGEVRRFDYRATVASLERVDVKKHAWEPDAEHSARRAQAWKHWERYLREKPIRGHKRFTYACGENPWNQLLYLNLDALGSAWWQPWVPWRRTRLKLDARFLAGKGVALMRITQQQNQVRALSDLVHLGLYFTRVFLKLHLWQLRQPDPPPAGAAQRLPGAVSGLPPPEITEIELEPGRTRGVDPASQPRTNGPASVRLTRYRRQPPDVIGEEPLPPIVFIHGYSASGTTFAHNAIEGNAARYFWERGRDVWVLDLRTSAGMPTARAPWAFEDVAWADIPVAIDHIARKVGQERGHQGVRIKVDLFAHCIGAVMTSMALLTPPQNPTRYPAELGRLRQNIRKLVLSQKGFFVEYSDANILRAYLLDYLKPLLQGGYSFRPSLVPPLRERLLDAFLATLPYPHEEWRRENPWWCDVPWSATRRRMDALYERTFDLDNMPPEVLLKIDDFFGPLNLETVSHTIHMARGIQIAHRNGDPWNTAPSLPGGGAVLWPTQGTLLLSAKDNGMVNPHTSQRMKEYLDDADIPGVQRKVLPGGHQDILIGESAFDTWKLMEEFLDGN